MRSTLYPKFKQRLVAAHIFEIISHPRRFPKWRGVDRTISTFHQVVSDCEFPDCRRLAAGDDQTIQSFEMSGKRTSDVSTFKRLSIAICSANRLAERGYLSHVQSCRGTADNHWQNLLGSAVPLQ